MAKGCCGHVLIWRETKPFLLFSCGLAIIPKCTFPRLLASNLSKSVIKFQKLNLQTFNILKNFSNSKSLYNAYSTNAATLLTYSLLDDPGSNPA